MLKMKKTFSHFTVIILQSVFTFILFTDIIVAQPPGWIEQELPQSMTGTILADRGSDVLVFTKNYSDIIYFFDTRINNWTEVNLGTQQTFQKVVASGNTVFAYSDEYLVGYSSILSQWDTLSYQGTVIDPTGVSITKGYGCGNLLAYFITDANIFYVFDSQLAEWQEYNFGIVTNASSYNYFWAADNYAGAILGRSGYDYAKNIAYSLLTHSFAELDQGGWYYYPENIMNGGYVASWGNAVDEYKYMGYSSSTNEFKTITFPGGYDVIQFGAWINSTSFDRLEDIYVYTCGYEIGDQINRDVTVKSYSTKTGNWHTLQYSYDPRDLSGSWGKRGGSFSLGWYRNDTDLSISVWKFYGSTGTYIGENADLFSSQPIFVCGGTVAVGIGEHNLWFHNFENGSTTNKYYPPNNDIYYTGLLDAEYFCSVMRINTTSDTMKVFFFNGNTNNLQSIETNKKSSPRPKASARVYGCVLDGPDNEVIFYSPELDLAVKYNAAETIYGTLSFKNFLMGLTISSGNTVIFDAGTAQIYEKNITLSSSSIGDSIIFAKSGDMELSAYSGITKIWSVKQTDQMINGYQVGDEIAIGYSAYNAKYWGYSAYDDTYYELIPEGETVSVSSMAGGKTAIVIRTTKIYAFSPGNVTAINSNITAPVKSYSLYQNYPNPFNPNTTVKYSIPTKSKVIIRVYDILGNEIKTLVNEEKSMGTYEINWDATSLPSGVYFYHLKAGNHIQTKKMLLVK